MNKNKWRVTFSRKNRRNILRGKKYVRGNLFLNFKMTAKDDDFLLVNSIDG